jgi:hypothetical protein
VVTIVSDPELGGRKCMWCLMRASSSSVSSAVMSLEGFFSGPFFFGGQGNETMEICGSSAFLDTLQVFTTNFTHASS